MPSSLAFLILTLPSLLSIYAQSSSCYDGTFSFDLMGKSISQCKKLETLEAEFGWNYYNKTSTVDVLFGARLPDRYGWVAWGVNPVRPQMVETRAFIAIKHQNGSLSLESYYITQDNKLGCRLQPSPIGLNYSERHLSYSHETGFLTMFVKVTLPSYNLSNLNHVWQVGSHVEGMEPKMHATRVPNFDSCEVINLISGVAKGHRLRHLRQVHGILNIIGWGTLLPIGIIAARYFKKFPVEWARWCRCHLACQVGAFLIGTIGWSLGISIGSASKNYTFSTHRILGITIYSVAILQMLALWLRPKKHDDYRKYWHIYHHFLGYSLFSLIVVNIFQGINIIRPAKWKWAYVGILSVLGLIVLVLEIFTWSKYIDIVIKDKKKARGGQLEAPKPSGGQPEAQGGQPGA